MQLWSKAQQTIENADENTEIELPFQIVINNKSIPIILTDRHQNIIKTANIDPSIEADSLKLVSFFNKIKNQNEPIRQDVYYLYYGNSSLIEKLKYYPIALLLIIFLLVMLVYSFYKTSKVSSQNKLWAGMAKETAHQIGTPLSSLLGWLEILKLENINESTVSEIEKDIDRLQTIANRFSKIGSEPVLEPKNIVVETQKSLEYLSSRVSQSVHFSFDAPKENIITYLNSELYSWSIENLVKNAIDAMKGKGNLSISIITTDSKIFMYISDTGKGIAKNNYHKVFEPGFTTKKRGWGLGLSLTKRIIETYHKGKIKIAHSEIGKGTTFQIELKKM
jgi:signal transduction histidine kinase